MNGMIGKVRLVGQLVGVGSGVLLCTGVSIAFDSNGVHCLFVCLFVCYISGGFSFFVFKAVQEWGKRRAARIP